MPDLFDQFVTPALQVRPYQKRICTKIHRFTALEGFKTVMVESPTGSGKTCMGLMAARMIQETTGLRVGWMCMNRTLLHQAEAENKAKGINVKCEFFSMFDKNPPQVDVLFHDEAQHDAATNAGRIHNEIRPKFIIGLTATPFRTDHVKLCFEKVIKDIGIYELIRQGYLSKYDHYTIKDFSIPNVIDLFVKERQRWGKSFIFFLTKEQCYAAQTMIEQYGITDSEVVHADTDRERQLNDFREGKLTCLIGMKTISEGIDAPDLKTVFVRDSAKGPTIQMAGRVFRRHNATPIKQIVQSEQTNWTMLKTAMPETQYLHTEGEWRTLQVNPHINRVAMNSLRAIGNSPPVEMPKILTQAKKVWNPARR